jgi:hypothetical protein
LERVTKKTSFSAAGKAVLRALYIGLLGALLEKLFGKRCMERYMESCSKRAAYRAHFKSAA